MGTRSFRIAGVSFSVHGEKETPIIDLPDTYALFPSDGHGVDCHIQLRCNSPTVEMENITWEFTSKKVWAAFRWQGGWGFVTPHSDVAPWQRLILWSPAKAQADLWFRAATSFADIWWNLRFPFFAAVFAHYGGLLLHAAALEMNGKVWLFVGRSGSGKSHWSRQWLARGGTVLDEDRVVLREREGQIWAFGTPWHPEPRLCSQRGAPVERIFFLRQAEPDTLSQVQDSTAAALLLRHCFLPVYDPQAMQIATDVAGQTALQVSALHLGYATDGDLLNHLMNL